jgi:hypothetical protein
VDGDHQSPPQVYQAVHSSPTTKIEKPITKHELIGWERDRPEVAAFVEMGNKMEKCGNEKEAFNRDIWSCDAFDNQEAILRV